MSSYNDKRTRLKRYLILLFLPLVPLLAKEYYAKVEPYEMHTIASNVSGLVVHADESREGQRLGDEPYVKIDDELDTIELVQIEEKITLLQNTLGLNEEMARNYAQMLEKKQANYDRIKGLKIKSTIEKDREFYDLVTTQNQSISTQKEVENLKIQINDLQLRRAQLGRMLRDKRLSAPGFVLYKLLVKEGQVVNPSTPLAEIADVSKAKLTVYLNAEDMASADSKVIYLDGKKSRYRVSRLWKIADSTHLSSYKAEIVIDAPERFSQLLKLELRGE